MKACSIGLLHFKFQILKKRTKIFGSIIKVSVVLKTEKNERTSATLTTQISNCKDCMIVLIVQEKISIVL